MLNTVQCSGRGNMPHLGAILHHKGMGMMVGMHVPSTVMDLENRVAERRT